MKRACRAYLMGTIALAGTPALAQESGQGSAADDADTEIIVTANKREQSVNDVPMSITAVTGEKLAQGGINDVASLTSLVPGFTFTKTHDSIPVLSIRGVGYYDNNPAATPAVSVYVDEVPLPFPIMSQGALFDLERVEVLKGPQGTLFGQNSTGGALNFIAAKPENSFGGSVAAGYGRFNTFDIGGHVTGPLTDTLRARFAVRYENGDGWQRSYTHLGKLGAIERAIARLSFEWEPAASTHFLASAEVWKDQSEPQAAQLIGVALQFSGGQDPRLATGDPGGVFGAATPLQQVYPNAPRKPRLADWTPGKNYTADNDYYRLALRAEQDLSDDMTLISTTAYQRLDIDQYVDADGTGLLISGLPTNGRLSSLYQELRLQGDVGGVLWMVGGNYSREKSNIVFNPEFQDWSLPIETAVYTTISKTRTAAVFGSSEFQLSDSLTLVGSARYTDMHVDYGGCSADSGDGTAAAFVNSFLPAPVVQLGGCYSLNDLDFSFLPVFADLNLDEDNFSWRAGINYEPTNNLLLYANVSKGFKAGAFTNATFNYLSQATPATQESLLAYEAGFKVGGRSLQVNGAVFYYDYKDKQVLAPFDDPILGLQDRLQNIPKSRIVGAEWQANLFPAEGLRFGFNGTYIDSKVSSTFVGIDPLTGAQMDFDGLTFPNTPKWQINGDFDYSFPLSNDLKATLGANVGYRSASFGRFGRGAAFEDLYSLEGRILVDLTARLADADDQYAVDFFARNIFNTYYREQATTFLDTVVAFAGRPATYGVRFSSKF
jgi:iron complex outermembrane receptor protein